ncbi:hypothetical protein BKA93DRAFT_596629, partial [Sparassis latifolia]
MQEMTLPASLDLCEDELERLTQGPSIPASPTALGKLPLEVWEHVMDYLWDDHLALEACSHACRAWFPRVERHLFRRITLRADECDLGIMRFTELSHIAQYVQDLILVQPIPLSSHSGLVVSFDPTKLLFVLQKLNRVRHLFLHNWRTADMMGHNIHTLF